MKPILRIFRDLLIKFIPKKFVKYFVKPVDFVWLVHPRDNSDTLKKFPFLKFLPEEFISSITSLVWPFILSSVSSENNNIKGYVVVIPLTPNIITNQKNFSVRKTKNAISFANKLGVKTMSLGGFLPSLVYRNNLDKKYPISFFDGTNILPRLAFKKIESVIKEHSQTKKENVTIGLIGATTIVGNTLAKLLIHDNKFNEIYLFGKTQSNLVKLKDECEIINKNGKVIISTDLSELKKCNLVILTAYLQKEEKIIEYLMPNITFFSVIEPISPFVFELKKQRKDINITMGISINTPGVNYKGYDFGLPKGDSFACVTEAMILVNNKNSIETIKSMDPQKSVRAVEELLDKSNFKSI